MKPNKQRYQGWRSVGDGGLVRAEVALRRATRNAQGQSTNAVIATSDAAFREACEAARIPPTTRQASKWRRKFGLAWSAHVTKRNAKAA
jgi:hypothetical protein